MSIIFYDHLIKKEEVIVLIETSNEPDHHKNKAKQLIDDIIHHEIINFILSRLDESKHRTFLCLIEERPYDPEILIYLRTHIGPSVENDLRQFADSLIAELKKDFLLEE